MSLVMVHYFPVEDFYKISYTGKDSVEAFEKQQKQWLGQEYSLSWSREFNSVETAKLLKKVYAKDLPRYQSTFIKSSLDTFKIDKLPEPTTVEEVAPRTVYVHLIKFVYDDKYLFKAGYSSHRAPVKYAGLQNLEVLWDVPVLEGEPTAKDFISYVTGKYTKVPVDGLDFSKALVVSGVCDVKTLKAEWLDSKNQDAF
jgi:hypothetical protein